MTVEETIEESIEELGEAIKKLETNQLLDMNDVMVRLDELQEIQQEILDKLDELTYNPRL